MSSGPWIMHKGVSGLSYHFSVLGLRLVEFYAPAGAVSAVIVDVNARFDLFTPNASGNVHRTSAEAFESTLRCRWGPNGAELYGVPADIEARGTLYVELVESAVRSSLPSLPSEALFLVGSCLKLDPLRVLGLAPIHSEDPSQEVEDS